MGATEYVGSDRYPFTVISVKNSTHVTVQRDLWKRTDNNGMSESQTYEYAPDPNGAIYNLSYTKKTGWAVVKNRRIRFSIGLRRCYLDPSF